jgi:hypothetical protein
LNNLPLISTPKTASDVENVMLKDLPTRSPYLSIPFLLAALGATVDVSAEQSRLTPDQLLDGLVQLATTADLTIRDQVSHALGLSFEIKQDRPVELDGQQTLSFVALEPPVGSLNRHVARFSYRVLLKPYRRANLDISFDRSQVCIPVGDVVKRFTSHGELRAAPQPTPPHNFYPESPPKEHAVYAYSFAGQKRNAYLFFGFRTCLVSFSTHQPDSSEQLK